MDADFTIETDRAKDLIRIALRGFFEPADIDRLRAALGAVHQRRQGRPNQHLTLLDIEGLKIQAQDSVAAFGTLLNTPAYQSRRLALVVGRSLTRSQAMRAITGRNARCFATPTEAEAWLFAEDAERHAA